MEKGHDPRPGSVTTDSGSATRPSVAEPSGKGKRTLSWNLPKGGLLDGDPHVYNHSGGDGSHPQPLRYCPQMPQSEVVRSGGAVGVSARQGAVGDAPRGGRVLTRGGAWNTSWGHSLSKDSEAAQ